MADYYLRSGNNDNNAGDGLSWATAKTSITGLVAISALSTPGNTVYVSHEHNENAAVTLNITFSSNAASPTRLLCVNHDTMAPATTANIAVSGNNNLTISGNVYAYGVNFAVNASTFTAILTVGYGTGTIQYYESCTMVNATTYNALAYRIMIGHGNSNTNYSTVVLHDCNVYCPNTVAPPIGFSSARVFVRGGTMGRVGGATTFLFDQNASGSGRPTVVTLEGVDLILGNSAGLVRNPNGACIFDFQDCRLPSTWTGAVVTNGQGYGWKVMMQNTDTTLADSRFHHEISSGVCRNSGSVYYNGFSGGAPYSIQMTSSASASLFGTLDTNRIVAEILPADVGVLKTVSIAVLTDDYYLSNNDMFIEVLYPGSDTTTKGNIIRSRGSLNLSESTLMGEALASWTTAGIATPRTMMISVQFTPLSAGVITVEVLLARPNSTVYVHPGVLLS